MNKKGAGRAEQAQQLWKGSVKQKKEGLAKRPEKGMARQPSEVEERRRGRGGDRMGCPDGTAGFIADLNERPGGPGPWW